MGEAGVEELKTEFYRCMVCARVTDRPREFALYPKVCAICFCVLLELNAKVSKLEQEKNVQEVAGMRERRDAWEQWMMAQRVAEMQRRIDEQMMNAFYHGGGPPFPRVVPAPGDPNRTGLNPFDWQFKIPPLGKPGKP